MLFWKFYKKSWIVYVYCWFIVLRKVFFGDRVDRLEGSLVCVLWVWELDRRKVGLLSVNCLNDNSSIINGYLLIRFGFMKVYCNLEMFFLIYVLFIVGILYL